MIARPKTLSLVVVTLILIASTATKAQQLEIPSTVTSKPVDRKTVDRIRDGKDWKNPSLTVSGDAIIVEWYEEELRQQRRTDLSGILVIMASLPGESWPYGPVVKLSTHPLMTKAESRKASRVFPRLRRLLREHRLTADLWPSA